MVWVLLLITSGSINIAPQTYTTRQACEAVAAQIPKGSGGGKCLEAEVAPRP